MKFFVGLHQPSDAKNVGASFVSVNRLRARKSDFQVGEWIMDSGAFSTILTHGGYPHSVEEYAAHINRWKHCGRLLAVVAQDYMCEPKMLEITGLDIPTHQRLTIDGDPRSIEDVLLAIKGERPDLRLHGFWSEDDSAEIWDCARIAPHCGFDGLELRGPYRGKERKRLAGGSHVR